MRKSTGRELNLGRWRGSPKLYLLTKNSLLFLYAIKQWVMNPYDHVVFYRDLSKMILKFFTFFTFNSN